MKKKSFEEGLAKLENITQELEEGDLSLEESLKHFERGIVLTKSCQQALSEAEQKVSILLGKDGNSKLEPFKPDNNEE